MTYLRQTSVKCQCTMVMGIIWKKHKNFVSYCTYRTKLSKIVGKYVNTLIPTTFTHHCGKKKCRKTGIYGPIMGELYLFYVSEINIFTSYSYVRLPHQTSDMLTNFKMIVFAFLKTLMTYLQNAKTIMVLLQTLAKLWRIMCRRGKKLKTEKMSFVSAFEHTIISGALF